MDMPPSRYRVVERGRRLVVIDRWHGERPVAPGVPVRSLEGARRPEVAPPPEREPHLPVDRPASSLPLAGAGIQSSAGEIVITTQRWFDTKGPRRIVVAGYSARQMLNRAGTMAVAAVAVLFLAGLAFPPLWFLPALVLAKPIGGPIRLATTRWLDALAQASIGSSAG